MVSRDLATRSRWRSNSVRGAARLVLDIELLLQAPAGGGRRVAVPRPPGWFPNGDSPSPSPICRPPPAGVVHWWPPPLRPTLGTTAPSSRGSAGGAGSGQVGTGGRGATT